MKKLMKAAKKLFAKPEKEEDDIFGQKGNGKTCPICKEEMKPEHRMMFTGNFPKGMHDYCWPKSFAMAMDDLSDDLGRIENEK